jgi:hypothetical protein
MAPFRTRNISKPTPGRYSLVWRTHAWEMWSRPSLPRSSAWARTAMARMKARGHAVNLVRD